MKYIRNITGILLMMAGLAGCEKFVDVGLSNTYIGANTVFGSDGTAISLATGMYNKMVSSSLGFGSGAASCPTILGALSSDELSNAKTGDASIQALIKNNLTPNHSYVAPMWTSCYQVIYAANELIEGLPGAAGVSANLKKQLLGEAYFIRAFSLFYVTSFFGDVPLVTTTSYEVNANPVRTPVAQVYDQVISDLKEAATLLKQAEDAGGYTYVTTDRTRPNSWAAKFLLARTCLYAGKWAEAEAAATEVINHTATYSLLTDLNQVFKANSGEAVWQLKSTATSLNTFEGEQFILTYTPGGVGQSYYLSPQVYNDFEANDKRKINWTSTFTNTDGSWNFAYKYKVRGTPIGQEYSMVLRFAEMYLVRAEARANNSKLSEAIQDVDVVRNRAGITLIQNTNPGITKNALLDVILHERRVELFTEWGHRWLDLIRVGKADAYFSALKGADWQPTDKLFPLPLAEVQNGRIAQNPGY